MKYPNTQNALLELAYDVGAINRLEPEEECIEKIKAFFIHMCSTTEVEYAEKFFSNLSPAQLAEFIGGEETEVEKKFAGFEGYQNANEILNKFFLIV